MSTTTRRILLVHLCAAMLGVSQEFHQIDYLCCDWGPAMKTPATTNDVPTYNTAEDEVYFIKQMTLLRREKLSRPELVSGSTTRDVWLQRGIFLCKMRRDGTGKTELKELWRNPSHPIDTQAQTTWMNVNAKTKKIVLSIVVGGSEIVGLWTMNLDGSQLKRIQEPRMEEGGWSGFAHPSWTPDGEWIVFGKGIRRPDGLAGGIAKCTAQGSNTIFLTNSPDDSMPAVSPDGKRIVFVVISAEKGGLWLMDADGRNACRLPNPDDKRKGRHGGLYPTWSPDGHKIMYTGISETIADVATGRILVGRAPRDKGAFSTTGWAHWGSLGFIGFCMGGIIFSDPELEHCQFIANTGRSSSSRL